MRIVQTILSFSVLLGVSAALASDDSYRLAGSIITDDHGTTLALVETSDGTQHLLREGDILDGGTVVEITRNSVHLQFETGEVLLTLAGTEDRETGIQYRLEDYAESGTTSVGVETLAEIASLAAITEKSESAQRASRVLAYLDLPSDARIMAVDDEPVESPAEALQKIAANIDQKTDQAAGFLFRISVTGTGGNRRIYVFADESGQIDDQPITAN